MTRKGELDAETKSCDREIKVKELLDQTCTTPTYVAVSIQASILTCSNSVYYMYSGAVSVLYMCVLVAKQYT